MSATNKAVDEFLRQKRQGIPRDTDRSEGETQRKIFERESKNPDTPVYDFSDLTDQYQERDIIRILLNYGDKNVPESNLNPLCRYIMAGLSDIIEDFQHPVYKKIIEIYQSFIASNQVPTAAYFAKHPDPDIQHLAIELLTVPYEYASWDEHDIPLQMQLHPDDNFKKDAHNAILRLKLKVVMKHIEDNQAKIGELQQEGNDEELAIHIRMHYDLHKVREQITTQFKNVVLKI